MKTLILVLQFLFFCPFALSGPVFDIFLDMDWTLVRKLRKSEPHGKHTIRVSRDGREYFYNVTPNLKTLLDLLKKNNEVKFRVSIFTANYHNVHLETLKTIQYAGQSLYDYIEGRYFAHKHLSWAFHPKDFLLEYSDDSPRLMRKRPSTLAKDYLATKLPDSRPYAVFQEPILDYEIRKLKKKLEIPKKDLRIVGAQLKGFNINRALIVDDNIFYAVPDQIGNYILASQTISSGESTIHPNWSRRLLFAILQIKAIMPEINKGELPIGEIVRGKLWDTSGQFDSVRGIYKIQSSHLSLVHARLAFPKAPLAPSKCFYLLKKILAQ